MLNEFEFFHGLVLARLVHNTDRPIAIARFPSESNAGYVINERIGLFVKHSKKRLSPWRFSFLKEHLDQISAMREKLDALFVALVCNDDGIVCLSYSELTQVLDEQHDDSKWMCITRRPRKMYTVSGSDGLLRFKVGANEFPPKLFGNHATPPLGSAGAKA
jgi:hypothetical protein